MSRPTRYVAWVSMREQGAGPERAQVSAESPEATGNDSRLPRGARSRGGLRLPTVGIVRLVLAICGAAGALLLVVSTFATVIEIKVLTTSSLATDFDTDVTGGDRHGVAMVVLAVFAVVMLAGAVLRGARPAMAAVAAAGIIALSIAIASDAQHIHDTGQVGELYEDASADAGSGFFYETLGGALLLISGGGLLLFAGAGARAEGEPDRPRRDPVADEPPEPRDEPRPSGGDWFS
jgi:hypothetical protein